MAIDAWLTLLCAAERDSPRWRKALGVAGSAEALVADSTRSLAALGLDDEAIGKLRSPDVAKIDRWKRWLEAPRRALVALDDARFPPRLAELPDPPLALWVEGPERALLAAAQLAIVGSRNPTATGRETAREFAKYLAARGLTITSGLATGIDGASHRGAVGELGRTIAVLGSGLDAIYPREHERLAAEIAERGLLVAEYGPGTTAQKFFFPERNRIIAGLSVGTLVVEATRRSGSLITARRALDYGREVFAIPGSIHNPLARGCHLLIRQGAKLVEEAADILIELGPQLDLDAPSTPSVARIPATAPAKTPVEADETYRRLLDVLDFAPVSISELRDRCQLTTAELSSMLLVLELDGLVEALPGGRYARFGKREQ